MGKLCKHENLDISYCLGEYWINCKDCGIDTEMRASAFNPIQEFVRKNNEQIFARIKEELEELRKNIELNSFETISKHFDQGRITGIDRSIEIIERIEKEV